MLRTAGEVASQAIICGTLGFRASLEVTEHQRTRELCSQLLPWLDKLGLGEQIEELHREILESPYGSLPQKYQTEAFWRGETASFLGWSIHLFDKPSPTALIDPALLLQNLRILQPTASEILTNAHLRSRIEIEEYCAYCLTVRHQLQLAVLPAEARDTLTTIHQNRIAELGLTEALSRLKGIEAEGVELAVKATGIRGLYAVRGLASEWLLAKDE
jgi:hypothetical protein